MVDRLRIPQHNLLVVDFSCIFKQDIETNLLNDLHRFVLLNKKISKPVRQLFYYHIIYGICEACLKNRGIDRLIFFFNQSELLDSEMIKYYDREILFGLLKEILNKIEDALPVIVYRECTIWFTELTDNHTDDNLDAIFRMKQLTASLSSKDYSFAKIRKLTTKHNLTFLDKHYFNQIKTKLLLIA